MKTITVPSKTASIGVRLTPVKSVPETSTTVYNGIVDITSLFDVHNADDTAYLTPSEELYGTPISCIFVQITTASEVEEARPYISIQMYPYYGETIGEGQADFTFSFLNWIMDNYEYIRNKWRISISPQPNDISNVHIFAQYTTLP